eukprot:2345486-Rhodomonas_salina.5
MWLSPHAMCSAESGRPGQEADAGARGAQLVYDQTSEMPNSNTKRKKKKRRCKLCGAGLDMAALLLG